jgi:hypothetical protein
MVLQVYRDRYPGAGHIAKNVAALIGVVAKTHVGEIIELGMLRPTFLSILSGKAIEGGDHG